MSDAGITDTRILDAGISDAGTPQTAPPKFDVMAASQHLADMQQLAGEIEKAGLDGIWLTEGGRTAYLNCATAALATKQLTIGTAIALAFPRSPMITAQVAWELADATAGRFVLGIGTQVKAHIERRFSMPFDPPGPRLKEYVLALRAIFEAFQNSSPMKFEGRYYNHEMWGTTWNPGPIQHPNVPIYISAVRPWMCRMAGEVADGIHLHPFHSPDYIKNQMLPHIIEGTERAGRDLSEVVFVIPTMICVGDTEEEMLQTKEHTRAMIAFYGTTRAYAGVFEEHGYDGLSAQLHKKLREGDHAGQISLVTDEILDNYVVTATWESLAETLLERYRGIAPNMRLMTYTAISQIARAQKGDKTGEAGTQSASSVLARWGQVAKDISQKYKS